MPALDYFDITVQIADILRAHSELQGVRVQEEGEHSFQAGIEPWVGVYFERRDPSPNQPLDAGQSTRYLLRFTLWCWCMSLNEIKEAIQMRNALVDKVERALMANRKLNNKVSMSWLAGGDMPSGRFSSEGGDTAAVYLSGGEIILLAEASSSIT